MNERDAVAEYVRRLTSLGGKARAKALGAKRRKEIARQGARKRWAKHRPRSKSRARRKP